MNKKLKLVRVSPKRKRLYILVVVSTARCNREYMESTAAGST
jgi:hypothetical protein